MLKQNNQNLVATKTMTKNGENRELKTKTESASEEIKVSTVSVKGVEMAVRSCEICGPGGAGY